MVQCSIKQSPNELFIAWSVDQVGSYDQRGEAANFEDRFFAESLCMGIGIYAAIGRRMGWCTNGSMPGEGNGR